MLLCAFCFKDGLKRPIEQGFKSGIHGAKGNFQHTQRSIQVKSFEFRERAERFKT